MVVRRTPAQTAAAAPRRAAATPAVVAVSGAAAGHRNEPRPAQVLPSPPQAVVMVLSASQDWVVELMVGEVAIAAG